MNTRSVLIVEDDTDLRTIYELILKHAGYEVRSASNGKLALDELASCQPGLILLDIFMPEMDGQQFLETIKLKDYPGMKVVVCSNTSDTELMDTMVKLGADKVVLKANLDPNDLVELVSPYLNQ